MKEERRRVAYDSYEPSNDGHVDGIELSRCTGRVACSWSNPKKFVVISRNPNIISIFKMESPYIYCGFTLRGILSRDSNKFFLSQALKICTATSSIS